MDMNQHLHQLEPAAVHMEPSPTEIAHLRQYLLEVLLQAPRFGYAHICARGHGMAVQ
jgi:hypothetical protein